MNKLTWALVAVIAVLAIILAAILLGTVTTPDKLVKFLNPIAPIVAVIVALLALGVTATSTFVGAKRSKRQSTLDAWVAWSETSRDDRKSLSDLLGSSAINASQAKSLLTKGAILQGKSGPLSNDEKAAVSHAMTEVLNGLERLAVGVQSGVYDEKTLVSLGGTIIRRNRERFESYIVARRESPNLTIRQRRAYIALDNLARNITQRHTDEDRLSHLRS